MISHGDSRYGSWHGALRMPRTPTPRRPAAALAREARGLADGGGAGRESTGTKRRDPRPHGPDQGVFQGPDPVRAIRDGGGDSASATSGCPMTGSGEKIVPTLGLPLGTTLAGVPKGTVRTMNGGAHSERAKVIHRMWTGERRVCPDGGECGGSG